jgi:predicted N-acetyltransferase YhbS
MDTAKPKPTPTTKFTLRPAGSADIERLGEICYEAFRSISEAHNFPPDFPEIEVARGLITHLVGRGDVFSVVAESDGRVLGRNFLWTGDSVAGVGPITVDPSNQNSSVGRALMEAVIEKAFLEGKPSVRLVQAAFHNRSLSLYTKLGFDTVEPLSNIQGPSINIKVQGYDVRPMKMSDLDETDALARRVHGHDRHNETAGAIEAGSARVVAHDGRITGYTTGVGFFGHTVGESNEDLKALIGAAENFPGPGFLLPTRNSELMRWCLANGLRVVQPMTLMSKGLYQEPRGVFLPSILF